jgi:endonuclease YncB( thermonuclease family)
MATRLKSKVDYLVRQGYAQFYTYLPDVKYQEQLRLAQQEAMANNRGLWGRCETEPGTMLHDAPAKW